LINREANRDWGNYELKNLKMKIRPAKTKDLEEIVKVGQIKEFRGIIDSYFHADFIKNYLHKDFFLVLEKEKKIIGFLIAEPVKANGALLWYIAIIKEERGRGGGKKLLKEFEKRCKKNKVEWIILYCPTKSQATKLFYKKQGYTKHIQLLEYEKYL